MLQGPSKQELEHTWLVLEVTDTGAPCVLVSEATNNRIEISDNFPVGASFQPGEFVWFVITLDEFNFIEATALNETGLRDFQQFAARYGLTYRKGIQPKQAQA
jgi:hypothetical protein